MAHTLTPIDLDDPDVGYLTPDQYLEAERASDGKREYHAGEIVTLRLDSIGADLPLREAYLKTSLLDT